MFKRTFILILLLFLASCGYESIHSKKNSTNYNFSISDLTFIGDRNVNVTIKEKLNNYTSNKKTRDFALKILTKSEKIVLSKDASGNPANFKFTITINIEVLEKNNFKNNIQITESFNYNSVLNKFDLKRYEKEIVNNLAETGADKLINKLSNI